MTTCLQPEITCHMDSTDQIAEVVGKLLAVLLMKAAAFVAAAALFWWCYAGVAGDLGLPVLTYVNASKLLACAMLISAVARG